MARAGGGGGLWGADWPDREFWHGVRKVDPTTDLPWARTSAVQCTLQCAPPLTGHPPTAPGPGCRCPNRTPGNVPYLRRSSLTQEAVDGQGLGFEDKLERMADVAKHDSHLKILGKLSQPRFADFLKEDEFYMMDTKQKRDIIQVPPQDGGHPPCEAVYHHHPTMAGASPTRLGTAPTVLSVTDTALPGVRSCRPPQLPLGLSGRVTPLQPPAGGPPCPSAAWEPATVQAVQR